MIELTPEQIKHYFHRSYVSVDGLWFMKVEERYGFDTALDIDEAVWCVMPKIQARMIKSFGNLDAGIEDLYEGLTTKLVLEGYVFSPHKTGEGNGFDITVTECPWHNLMKKSGREHLHDKIAKRICTAENTVWAAEFGDTIEFEHGLRICKGDHHCEFKFRENKLGVRPRVEV